MPIKKVAVGLAKVVRGEMVVECTTEEEGDKGEDVGEGRVEGR